MALAITLALGFAATEAKSGPIVLKAVTAFPKNHLNNDPVPILVNKINRKAAGQLKIDWVGGPEVIKSFDQVHALKKATYDGLEKASHSSTISGSPHGLKTRISFSRLIDVEVSNGFFDGFCFL